jgi:uncharacterized protein (TIGR02145 family)
MNRILLLIGFLTLSISNAQTPGSGVTIDGYTYPTVIINGREWMAENLKASHYESGTPFVQMQMNTGTSLDIVNAPTTSDIMTGPYSSVGYIIPTAGSDNGNGLLYNYNAVAVYYNGSTTQIIKSGWHVPSVTEWNELIGYTGQLDQFGVNVADNMRKVNQTSAPFTAYWNASCGGNFNDQYGFSAVGVGAAWVSGIANGLTSEMRFDGSGAFFWATYAGTGDMPYARTFCNSGNFIGLSTGTINRKSALSIRLIKDVPLSNDNFDKLKVLIFPNPAKDYLNIQSESEITGLAIIDITGKIVHSQQSVTGQVNIEKLKIGMYILKITSNNQAYSYKLIKN